jgi:hypothetical protein
MHASIWKFAGDPDELLRRYDAVLEEIPRARMRLHVCLRAPDGIVLVDTCPTKEVFESFAHGDDFRALRKRFAGKKMLPGRVAQAELGYRPLDPASAAPARTSPLS